MESMTLDQTQIIPKYPAMSNQQLVEAYLNSITLLSPATIYHWQKFFAMLLKDIDKSFQELTAIDLRTYIIKKKTEGSWKTANTIQIYVTCLKSFFKFLVLEHYIDDSNNPAKSLKLPSIGATSVYRTISTDEMRLLIKAAESPAIELRKKLLFYIAITTGLRAKEIISIKKQNIDFKKRLIFIPKDDVKGRYREKLVPLSLRTKEILELYLIKHPSPIDNIFFNHWGKPLRVDYVYFAMREVIDTAYPYKNSWNKPCGSHLARHTFATRWIESGGDIHALRAVMGWKSFNQLDRYVDVSPNFISTAAKKIERKMFKRSTNETNNA